MMPDDWKDVPKKSKLTPWRERLKNKMVHLIADNTESETSNTSILIENNENPLILENVPSEREIKKSKTQLKKDMAAAKLVIKLEAKAVEARNTPSIASWELELKKDEVRRIYETIQEKLFSLIKVYLPEGTIETKDFCTLMGYITTLRKRIPYLNEKFNAHTLGDIRNIRNDIAHNNPSTEKELNKSIRLLTKFRDFFGIKPTIVPLRVMACKHCNTIITRTAQPTKKHTDLSGTELNICRTYDVQSGVVGGYTDMRGEASRENTWYDSWIWTYTICAKCYKNGRVVCLGFRFDWAPEELVDLSTCKVKYMLEQESMVVMGTAGSITDLTHIVSDGKIRHHHYGLFERELVEV
jgi:hypothetical protein